MKKQAITSWVIIGKDEVGSSNLPSSSMKKPVTAKVTGFSVYCYFCFGAKNQCETPRGVKNSTIDID